MSSPRDCLFAPESKITSLRLSVTWLSHKRLLLLPSEPGKLRKNVSRRPTVSGRGELGFPFPAGFHVTGDAPPMRCEGDARGSGRAVLTLLTCAAVVLDPEPSQTLLERGGRGPRKPSRQGRRPSQRLPVHPRLDTRLHSPPWQTFSQHDARAAHVALRCGAGLDLATQDPDGLHRPHY